jgi:photosystem II stability/assembly factor-like uncharacterized protein
MLWGQEYLERLYQAQEGTKFSEIKQLADEYFQNRDRGRGSGYKQYKRWEYLMQDRLGPDGELINYNRMLWEASKGLYDITGDGPEIVSDCDGSWTIIAPTNDYINGPSGYNPGLGRVNVVAFHPDDAQTIFVGTPSGGLWKTTNQGNSWFPLTDKLPSIGVSGIAIHPTNPNRMYILTGDGDGGNTFSIGVLKTTNGGMTWQETSFNPGVSQMWRCFKLIMDPTDPDVMLAATNGGLLRTTDGWDSYTTVEGGIFVDIEYKPGSPATVYATTLNRFYRSTDSGQTWTEIATGLPAGEERCAIAVSADNPEYVYLLAGPSTAEGVFKGLYRSTNGGASFALRLDEPNILNGNLLGDGDKDQTSYDLAIAVDPQNAERVITGGINVWGSNNGGDEMYIIAHWATDVVAANSLEYTHADIHDLVYSPVDGSLWCASDGGVFRSTDDGETWADHSSLGGAGLAIMQFYRIADYPANANWIIGGTQDNGCNSWSGGANVTHFDGADGMDCMIDYTNPDILYHSRQNGGLRKSLDGGDSHTSIRPGASGGAWVTPYDMDPVNPAIIYAAYTDTIYRSANGGSTWTRSIPELGVGKFTSLHVAPANGSVIYAATPTRMWRSNDSGSNWTEITAGLPVGSANITRITTDVTNSNDVWATFSGFVAGEKVYRSTNAGTTWTNWSGSLPNVPANCIVYDDTEPGGDDAVYVGMDVGVFYRDNTMPDWVPYFAGLPNMPVFDLEVHVASGRLRAGTYGRGLWETPLYTPDDVAPNIACPPTQYGELGVDCTYELPDYTGMATAVDNCDPEPDITQSPVDGTEIGSNTVVTLTATDLEGNSKSCTFTVEVADVIPPVISCPADFEVFNDPGLCLAAVDFTVTATDNCTEEPDITCTPASGSNFDVGTTEVYCTAYDEAGNMDDCTFSITVIDNEPPNAQCQDIEVLPDDNGDYYIDANEVNNGSTDNCAVDFISVDPDFIPCFHEAYQQTVTLTVTDIHGNSSTCEATVTLLDDDDCDGVGNKCDLCPGGDDQVDANGDGLPDCKYFPGMEYLIDE